MEAQLLVIEDNRADVDLLQEAFEDLAWPHVLTWAPDGVQARALLRSVAAGTRPAPHLILMDLNLPCLGGRDLLPVIQAEPRLASIPLLVLSGSAWEAEALAALGLPPDRYLVKPDSYEGYLAAARFMRALWEARPPDPSEAGPGAGAGPN